MIDVGETTTRLTNALLVLRELVHLSSGHLAREPRFEVKALLGDHLYDDARAVGKLHLRRAELGGGHGAPAPELAALLDRAAAAGTPQYVELAYGEIKPALIAAVRVHLERLDPLVDEPTLRLLTQLLHRQERHVAELPAAHAGGTLADLGALPLADGERALHVQPFERPARDEFVAIVEHPGTHAVHDLMNGKLYVAEMTARRSHERADMPWEFHEDMARVSWDNIRHAEVLDRLMATELGCHWGDHPVALAPPGDGLPGDIPEPVAAYLRADEAQHARIHARWG